MHIVCMIMKIYSNSNKVFNVIDNDKTYQVSLDGFWTCTCGVNGVCKHMHAAFNYNPTSNAKRYSKWARSIVKSALQKAVRRSLVDEAIQYTWWMLDYDPNDTVRRLMIIIVEDVMPHPWMPFLADMLDKKQLTHSEKEKVVMIARDIAASEARVYFNPSKLQAAGQYLHKSKIEDCVSDIPTAIAKRSRMGGMQGDIKMLIFNANWWAENWAESNHWLDFPTLGKPVLEMRKLTQDMILVEAVDQHCYRAIGDVLLKDKEISNFVTHLQREYANDWHEKRSDIIKWCIWVGRSCLTNKVDVFSGKVKGFWSQYEMPYLADKFCKKFANKIDELSSRIIKKGFKVV